LTQTREITIAVFFAGLALVGFGLWYKNQFIDKKKSAPKA
jgi:hypothetical protein